MASLCKCGTVNCEFDQGGDSCPIFQQQHSAAFDARAEETRVARIMIRFSGVNNVNCHICHKNCDGIEGLRTHLRAHYIPFPCNVCGLALANNTSASRHIKKCPGLNSMIAYMYFHSENERLMVNYYNT